METPSDQIPAGNPGSAATTTTGPDTLPASGRGSAAKTTQAAASKAATARVKAKPSATERKARADNEPVRLIRHQDQFITEPMTPAEASETMAGYPGEYEIYKPPVGAE